MRRTVTYPASRAATRSDEPTTSILEEATMRLLTAFTIVCLVCTASAPAQESRIATPGTPAQEAEKRSDWQGVITKQIEAFRAADAAAALSCAGESFRNAFTEDPNQFYEYIANSEFSPIVKSTSHSFGEFKMAEDSKTVLQIVRITASDKRVYKAIYEMQLESAGWRVQLVTRLVPEDGDTGETVEA